VTYPADVIKTHVQQEQVSVGARRTSAAAHARLIWRRRGARGFWVGLPATMARAIVSDPLISLNENGFVCLIDGVAGK
jgi:hypothetical protein